MIRSALQAAREFEASSKRAQELLHEIERVRTSAKECEDTINTTLGQTATILNKTTETQQEIAGLAIQAGQHRSNAEQDAAIASAASRAAQNIASRLPEIKEEFETAKTSMDELTARAKDLVSTFEQASSTALTALQTNYDAVKNATESETQRLREGIAKQSEELAVSAATLQRDSAETACAFR